MTRLQLKESQKKLVENGWKEEFTAMCGETPDNRFGILYSCKGEYFWLNKNTFSDIPVFLQ